AGRVDRGSESLSRGANVPRGTRFVRLRPGRSDLRADGRRGGRAPRPDHLLGRELHRRAARATAPGGGRQLALDAGRVRDVLERPERKRPGNPPGAPAAARRRQRAGGAGHGGGRPATIRRHLVHRDHRDRRAGRRHSRQAGRDRLARAFGTAGHHGATGEVSRRQGPGAPAVRLRRAATPSRGARSRKGSLSMGWREVAERYRVDLILFPAALAAYALSSDGLLAHQSLAPHFVYQADEFLHGQLHLTMAQPPNLNDWVLQGGRWYVSFPPFPAVLMMPFVALQGLSFNDVAFTLFFAAANVSLLYRLLRRLQPSRPEWEHIAFALIYGFGTLA